MSNMSNYYYFVSTGGGQVTDRTQAIASKSALRARSRASQGLCRDTDRGLRLCPGAKATLIPWIKTMAFTSEAAALQPRRQTRAVSATL